MLRSLIGLAFAMFVASALAAAILIDNVQVKSCGAAWTAQRQWIACVIYRNGFDR